MVLWRNIFKNFFLGCYFFKPSQDINHPCVTCALIWFFDPPPQTNLTGDTLNSVYLSSKKLPKRTEKWQKMVKPLVLFAPQLFKNEPPTNFTTAQVRALLIKNWPPNLRNISKIAGDSRKRSWLAICSWTVRCSIQLEWRRLQNVFEYYTIAGCTAVAFLSATAYYMGGTRRKFPFCVW